MSRSSTAACAEQRVRPRLAAGRVVRVAWVLGALLLGGWAAAVARESDDDLVLRLAVMAEDDPRASLGQATKELAAAADPRTRALLRLGQARAHSLLEEFAEQRAALLAAREDFKAIAGDKRRLDNWLALEELGAAVYQETRPQVDQRLLALRRSIRRDVEPQQACELTAAELWILVDRSSLDEAWVAAEELERCSSATPVRYLKPIALAMMGQIAVEMPQQQAQGRRAVDYYERALQALGDQPPRFRRSLFEWDLGKVHRRARQFDEALLHVGRALQLSRELDDRAGIGAALAVMAQIHLDSQRPLVALRLADEAYRMIEATDDGSRLIGLAALRIRVLAQLGRSEVAAEIDRARAIEREALPPAARADLASAFSEGYASVGRWKEALAELRRARELERLDRDGARDTQVLRLQARYDDVRRNAEIAELRHRNESAALALQAQQAGQRTLWIAMLLLTLVLTAAATQAWRLARRRRVLADLALKDELTGSANRRAVAAYAQTQFEQMRRLGLPMTLALIDLDQFKQVNDRHGHDAGDELLRAFTRAAGQVLRGQDRIGRWGGEEWLLVMPGTPLEELPRVFERLRLAYAQAVVPGMPQPHRQTFSMGGAQGAGDGSSLEELLRVADRRLYQAKVDGRDGLRTMD